VSSGPRVGRLIVITDTLIQSRFSHEQLAELACAGGAEAIQFRDKRLARGEFEATAKRVGEVCRAHQVTFIVNDRVVTAHDAGADGVHLGRDDMSIADARAILGPDKFIGSTAGSLDAALTAQGDGADYVGFGHIFATTSKAKETPPVGLEALANVCQQVTIPVIAIGGINADNVGEVMRAGAWGVAVIGAVCAADDPRAATAELWMAMGLE
jgi:thiamine-phosphate pyrophosphorylase